MLTIKEILTLKQGDKLSLYEQQWHYNYNSDKWEIGAYGLTPCYFMGLIHNDIENVVGEISHNIKIKVAVMRKRTVYENEVGIDIFRLIESDFEGSQRYQTNVGHAIDFDFPAIEFYETHMLSKFHN